MATKEQAYQHTILHNGQFFLQYRQHYRVSEKKKEAK